MPSRLSDQRQMTTGVLLVGHGTRSKKGRDQFLNLARSIAVHLPMPVEPAFLELCEPTIEQGVAKLVPTGVERLTVAPLLLFAAGHAKEDVPGAVSAACSGFGLPVWQAGHIGAHSQIAELAHRRLAEATLGRRRVPPDRTMLVIVGRGSSDPMATAAMREFGRTLACRSGLSRSQVVFLAVAEPSVAAVLPAIPERGIDRVIVHPHLLFHGELIEALEKRTSELASQRPEQEWIVSRVLADEEASDDTLPSLAMLAADWIEQEEK